MHSRTCLQFPFHTKLLMSTIYLVWAPESHQPLPLVGSDSGDLNTAKDKLMSLRYFCSIYLLIEKQIRV